MSANRNRVVVVVGPKGQIGSELRDAALSWVADGLIRPFLWVPNIESIQNLSEDSELPAEVLTSHGPQSLDLFQHLGSLVVERLELVCPWYLGAGEPDEELANQAVRLHKALQAILPQSVQKVNGKVEKRLVRSLLSIPTNEKPRTFGAKIDYRLFDHHIVVSPEVRALPWSGSAPLKSDSRFPFFVIAQIAGVGGLWAGFDRSLSSLLEERNHQSNPGEVLMLRTIASVVLAHGVSNRVAKDALKRVANPQISVYSDVSERETSRPRAIDSRNQDLIQSEINRKFDAALRIAGRSFTYFADASELDEGHSWRVTLQLLMAFAKTRLSSFWPYTVRWMKNVRSRVFKKLDSRTRIDEVELPIGIDEVLNKKVKSVNQLLADRKGQDAVAAATVSLQANPELWKNLRNLTYSSLDGGYSASDAKQVVVLPSASLLAPDPRDLFEVSEQEILEFFGLENSQLTFEEVADLRAKLNDYLENVEASSNAPVGLVEAVAQSDQEVDNSALGEDLQDLDDDEEVDVDEEFSAEYLDDGSAEDLEEGTASEEPSEERAEDEAEFAPTPDLEPAPEPEVTPKPRRRTRTSVEISEDEGAQE